MRTILLAGVIALAPFVAFAHGPQQAQGKLAFTGAGSLAGVQSTQGTSAASNVAGSGRRASGPFKSSRWTVSLPPALTRTCSGTCHSRPASPEGFSPPGGSRR